MMDPSKINRPVATVDRNAWFLRFYLWLWNADLAKVDFCRLFWGYVFAVPMLILRVFLIPVFLLWDFLVYMRRTGFWKVIDGAEWLMDHTITPVFRWIWNLIPQAPVATSTPDRGPAPAPIMPMRRRKKPKQPSKILKALKSIRSNGGEAFLSGVGKTADKGVETAQRFWPYFKWFFIAIGVVIAAAIAGVCGYLLWLLIGVLPIVGAAIWLAISWTGSGIAWLAVTVFTSQYVWLIPLLLLGAFCVVMLGMSLVNARPTRVAAEKVGKGTMGFGTAMKMGVRSVKYRTCPVIKIEE